MASNELPRQAGKSPWSIFWWQVNNPVDWLLMTTGCCGLFLWDYFRFNCRSLRESIFAQGVFSSPAIFIGTGVLLLFHLCFMYLPPLQSLFGSVALDLPVISLEKWWRRKGNGAA